MYGIVVIEKDLKDFEERIIEVSEKHDVIETDFTNFSGTFVFTAWCKEKE